MVFSYPEKPFGRLSLIPEKGRKEEAQTNQSDMG